MIDSGPGYFSLRDRDLRAEGLLVAEGRLLVERALVAKLDPLAVYASSEAYSDAERLVGGRVPVEVLDARQFLELAGYAFHRGLIGIFARPSISRLDPAAFHSSRLLVLPSITDPGNLGTLLRSALAFGWDAVALGTGGADPFNRKSLRGSMGAALSLSLFMAGPDDLVGLRERGYEVLAASLEDGARVASPRPLSDDVPSREGVAREKRRVLVLGNEFFGIDDEWRAGCDGAVMIPIRDGVDSLNVAVAGSLLLWALG
ncbi:MAG TPA: RNA methyltransferase [Treponemataceae bacterium]|nr:RNA methyltransferase [Treponemataceae bacterium]